MADDAIIVFDGVCVLCSRWTRFVLRFDRARHFRLAAMQTQAGRDLLRGNGLDPDDPSTFVVIDDGKAYTESTALLQVLSRFAWPWRLIAAMLRVLPRSLRDAGYRMIARNRYQWFGRTALCVVPVPEQRTRFIE